MDTDSFFNINDLHEELDEEKHIDDTPVTENWQETAHSSTSNSFIEELNRRRFRSYPETINHTNDLLYRQSNNFLQSASALRNCNGKI